MMIKNNFFSCGPLVKFVEFVTILFLFSVLVFWLWGMWDLSLPIRDRILTSYIRRRSLNHWTAREVPIVAILEKKEVQFAGTDGRMCLWRLGRFCWRTFQQGLMRLIFIWDSDSWYVGFPFSKLLCSGWSYSHQTLHKRTLEKRPQKARIPRICSMLGPISWWIYFLSCLCFFLDVAGPQFPIL